MNIFGAGKRHFCRERGYSWLRSRTDRFMEQGWVFGTYTRCGDGHLEPVYTHPNYKGLLLHENCCGSWNLYPGVIVEEVVVKKTPKFFYVD